MNVTKIMKFGGTSVGSPERFRALIPLVNDGENNIIVLSAMSGTTNSLIAITDAVLAGDAEKANENIKSLKEKYIKVVDELFKSDNYKNRGWDFINTMFDYISDVTRNEFSVQKEKIIHAQGEIMSTALFHLLLQEEKIDSVLLQALNFMRIDKDGEPDYNFIEDNLKRELRTQSPSKLIITQGFICRNA